MCNQRYQKPCVPSFKEKCYQTVDTHSYTLILTRARLGKDFLEVFPR